MPRLVTALLVRNEKDKYLGRVLRRCQEFSDAVLVLDDGSTDGSDQLARDLGCDVRVRGETGMWGNEAPARAELWNWGAEEAGDGWLLICDADMLLHGDPRQLTYATSVNAWAWVLFDVWNDERYYRCDTFWKGHEHPRIWMFRPSAMGNVNPEWPNRGIHCGHAPVNFPYLAGICDLTYYWSHLGWLDPADRKVKHERYLREARQLSSFERAHLDSVVA